MYYNHTKLHTFDPNLDNPHMSLGVKFFYYIRPSGPYICLAILGIILWLMTYLILFFFKDLLVTILKKESDRGYYYKYLEYTRFVKHVFGFSIIILIFWILLILVLHEWRWYVITIGGYSFTIFHTCYLIKYYLVDKNQFDLFDDYIFLFNAMRNKNKFAKIKKD